MPTSPNLLLARLWRSVRTVHERYSTVSHWISRRVYGAASPSHSNHAFKNCRVGDNHQMQEHRAMRSRFIYCLSVLLTSLFLASCSDTGIGAGVGAGGGALVGSAVGHPIVGALVGGAGGAVVGNQVGKN